MAEIDRPILSSFDARFIISTVLGRIGELTPCSAAAILEIDENDRHSAKLSLRRNSGNASIEEHQIRLAHQDISQLRNNPLYLQYDIGSNCPPYLRIFIDEGSQAVLIPTFLKESLSTVLIFVYNNPFTRDEEFNSLRKFANHVAVALSNAGWEERLYHQAHYDSLTNCLTGSCSTNAWNTPLPRPRAITQQSAYCSSTWIGLSWLTTRWDMRRAT